MDFDFLTDTIVATGPSGVLNISSIGGIVIPIGTTGERPSAPVNGMLRYSSTLTALELYINDQWQYVVPSPTAGTVIIQDMFANRPLFGSGNTIFISIDTNKMYRDTGSSWLEIGSLGTVSSVSASAPTAGFTISGSPITTSGTLTFVLANDLAALENLSSAGFAVRTTTDTWTQRTLTAASSKVLIINGDGVSGNPTVDVSEANLTLNNIGGTLGISKGGTNLSSLGTSNQILGVNNDATNLEYKTITAGSGIDVTYDVGTVTITSSNSPGGVTNNVQYNDNGNFAGSSAFNFVPGSNPVVNIVGTAATTQLTVGGSSQPNNATFYVEVPTETTSEGFRIYFNRDTPIGGWITCDYDQNAPNFRLTDEDDDPPYIQFNTVGNGSYETPQYLSYFGARGDYGTRTTGFEWRIGTGTANWGEATSIMTLDSQFLKMPTGTTAQRPASPTAGMMRFNTTIGASEVYDGIAWAQGSSGSTLLQCVHGNIPTITGTTQVPFDDSRPTSSEGFQIWTQSFTPKSAQSKIIISFALSLSHASIGRTFTTSVFAGSTNIGSAFASIGSTTALGTPQGGVSTAIHNVYIPGSTSTITFSARTGTNGSGTAYVNRNTSNTLNNSAATYYTIMEIL